jgi:hypothetical protein
MGIECRISSFECAPTGKEHALSALEHTILPVFSRVSRIEITSFPLFTTVYDENWQKPSFRGI